MEWMGPDLLHMEWMGPDLHMEWMGPDHHHFMVLDYILQSMHLILNPIGWRDQDPMPHDRMVLHLQDFDHCISLMGQDNIVTWMVRHDHQCIWWMA